MSPVVGVLIVRPRRVISFFALHTVQSSVSVTQRMSCIVPSGLFSIGKHGLCVIPLLSMASLRLTPSNTVGLLATPGRACMILSAGYLASVALRRAPTVWISFGQNFRLSIVVIWRWIKYPGHQVIKTSVLCNSDLFIVSYL